MRLSARIRVPAAFAATLHVAAVLRSRESFASPDSRLPKTLITTIKVDPLSLECVSND